MKKLTIASCIAFVFAIGLIAQDGAQTNIGIGLNSAFAPFIGPGGVPIGPVLFTDGTASLPSIAFNSQPALGLWRASSGIIGFTDTLGASGGAWVAGSGFAISSSRAYNFSSTGDATGGIDTQLLRPAAGVLAATTAFKAAFFASSASSVLTINSNVIAPANSIHHLGAGLVKTITVPATCSNTCSIDIVPDAAFTTDITGNISLASTAVTNRTLRFTWDGTKWNPSY